MASKQYVISETGEFPAQYMVLRLDDDGIYRPIFGPDPDLEDSERKCGEMNRDRAKNVKGNFVADDLSKSDIYEAYVGVKSPAKKKASVKRKFRKKKSVKNKK
jgi:hypothetical protein